MAISVRTHIGLAGPSTRMSRDGRLVAAGLREERRAFLMREEGNAAGVGLTTLLAGGGTLQSSASQAMRRAGSSMPAPVGGAAEALDGGFILSPWIWVRMTVVPKRRTPSRRLLGEPRCSW